MDKRHVCLNTLIGLMMLYAGLAYAEEFPAHPVAGSEISAESYVEDAYDAANDGVEVRFPYIQEHLYKIYLQEGFITDIRLGKDEKIRYVGGGDTVRWKIDTVTVGEGKDEESHLFIKPLKNGLSTNIVINTDKRMYQLILESGYGYNPMVSWTYPKSDIDVMAEEKHADYASIDPSKLKFGYSISNTKYKWSPEDVFRSESKTYLKMKSEITDTELPAFFALDDDDRPILVSYRFVDGYFIIDRLVDEGILVSGRKKVKIKFEGED